MNEETKSLLQHDCPHTMFLFLMQGAKLDLLLYVADNMAHFPYSVHEEPLFVIYHIDNILSVTGANMLHSFKEVSYVHTRQTVSVSASH